MARNANTSAAPDTNTPANNANATPVAPTATKAPSKHRARLDREQIERLTVEIPKVMFDSLTTLAKRDHSNNLPRLVKISLADVINGASLVDSDNKPVVIDVAQFAAATRTRTNKKAMTPEEKAAHELNKKLTTRYDTWFSRRLLENFRIDAVTKGEGEHKPLYTFEEWQANVVNAPKPGAPTPPNEKADANGKIVNKAK